MSLRDCPRILERYLDMASESLTERVDGGSARPGQFGQPVRGDGVEAQDPRQTQLDQLAMRATGAAEAMERTVRRLEEIGGRLTGEQPDIAGAEIAEAPSGSLGHLEAAVRRAELAVGNIDKRIDGLSELI